jgi:predicted CXXCH cytochrome family protein
MRAALVVLLLLPATPVLGKEGGEDGGPRAGAGRDALVAAVHAQDLKTGSACLECHKDTKAHADAVHTAKGVTCADCHPNVTDGKEPHKGALDALPLEKMCGSCHADQTSAWATGKHKDSTCDNCHGSVHSSFKRTDWSTCTDCHGKESEALAASAHGQAAKPVGCDDCHGDMHAPRLKGDPRSPVSKLLQVDTCGECHDTPDVRAWRTSVHGQGLLKAGLVVAPACVDCHGSHDIAKVKDPASHLSRKNVVDTCGQCHTFIETRWKESVHGKKWAEEIALDAGVVQAAAVHPEGAPVEGPVCTTCHSGHRTLDPLVYGNYLQMSDTCATCHTQRGGTYRDSFHGQATRLGFPAATCASCHTPHDMQPADNPRSSVNPKNLAKTCAACHEAVSASFLQFDPHMDPRDPHKNKVVHGVWLFMLCLLIGTLGLFTVHATLWLQRSIVARRRGELPPNIRTGTVWVRRFSPFHVGIHMTLVVTFLLLAATGLPLKFSYGGWPSWFEALFGGLAQARWLHRAAAVATLGYAVAYASRLIRDIIVRGNHGLLWGWKSMVPNGKDLRDVFENVRWFLYRGPRPKFDRWTYWEKFDFFAVFWGVPVIGLSGLMLWLPTWFSRVLPGWALNVAFLVHSDEALLAVGFIFFFHFFHTHLRPEAFPLDPTIFLGGMPLERFKEERPAEYQRLVAAGELDAQLMPPPSERTTRRAMRFAWTAFAVGLTLAVFLLAAGLKALFT